MLTIHRVAEPEGLVQRCVECGVVLLDFSPVPGMSVINEARPSFFQRGQLVTCTDGPARLHEGLRLEQALCRRTTT